MIVDRILDRKDNCGEGYTPAGFCSACREYGTVGADIIQAMALGSEEAVKKALCVYVHKNEYNPLLVDYINRVNWVEKTAPSVEIAAAKAFDEAWRAKEEAYDKMQPGQGRVSVLGYECGVLLSPEHDEFDFYAINNPELPYGFYDEDQGLFLMSDVSKAIQELKDYVKNGVENTYAVISFQGFADNGSDWHKSVLEGELETSSVSYSYFRNPSEVVWSARKEDGLMVEGFLEREINKVNAKAVTLVDQIAEVQKQPVCKVTFYREADGFQADVLLQITPENYIGLKDGFTLTIHERIMAYDALEEKGVSASGCVIRSAEMVNDDCLEAPPLEEQIAAAESQKPTTGADKVARDGMIK